MVARATSTCFLVGHCVWHFESSHGGCTFWVKRLYPVELVKCGPIRSYDDFASSFVSALGH